ncbi:MAG: NrfD/PsrC family molybdoenzyme membrane anchor subunit [Rhodocyclaceae bacterium]
MYYATQELWTWWLALYLFFGGLGAATVAVSALTDLHFRQHKLLVIWGCLSGFVMLGAGSSMLFIHLLHHAAVINVMTPMALIRKPDAWIAWGTQFITWMMFWSVLYALPYLRERPAFLAIPVVGRLLQSGPVRWLSAFALRFHRWVGWLSVINGVGTVVYTGLLLQSFPAVALWHNPGVPVLFTLSAFSTALAYLLLVLYLAIRDPADRPIQVFYERTDVIVIAAEIVVIFSFFQYMLHGSESARQSSQLLWHNYGWVIGFVLLGLIVPLMIELKAVTRGWKGHGAMVAAAFLVLSGGYLLRHYFMEAGVYERPFPPHGYSAYHQVQGPLDRAPILVPIQNRQVWTADR